MCRRKWVFPAIRHAKTTMKVPYPPAIICGHESVSTFSQTASGAALDTLSDLDDRCGCRPMASQTRIHSFLGMGQAAMCSSQGPRYPRRAL